MNPLDRHARRLDGLRRAVLDGDGVTDPKLRAAAASGASVPEPLGSYLAKVRDASYRITDDDVSRLKMDEEGVFEVTVAAALGAALERFEAGLRAVSGGGSR